jgi:hypothetical protein
LRGNLFDTQDFDINGLGLSLVNGNKHMQPKAIEIDFPVLFGANVINVIAQIRVKGVETVHLKH